MIGQKKRRCERLENLKKTPCSRIRYTRCITTIERANGKKEEISTRFHFLHGSLCARRIPIHASHRGAGTKGWRICGRLRRLALMRHATNEKRKEKKKTEKKGKKGEKNWMNIAFIYSYASECFEKYLLKILISW